MPAGSLRIHGDILAEDAARVAYERGESETSFVVRFHSDFVAFKELDLQVEAAWWPTPDPTVEAVVVYHSREKELTELRLAAALHAYPQVKELFIVGHNKLGTGNLHKRLAKQFAEADKVASARHSALIRVAKPRANTLRVQPEDWWESWDLRLDGEVHTIWDLPGVFSRGSLDRGTEMLIQSARDFRGHRVLDLGAGSGVVSIARGLRSPEAQLTLVEHDIFAVASAQRNIEALGLADRAQVIFGDMDSVADQRFDSVLSNPPFHAGSRMTTETTLRWFEGMKAILRPGGDLTLVANRHLPYADALDRAFKQVRVVDEDTKYRVWNARQPR